MKRYVVYTLFLLSFISLSAALATGAPMPIANTKHDLSSGSTATIRSAAGGTNQICVFCHTPHSARADAPLWNKTDVTGPYTLYNKATSDVLAQLGGGSYPDAEDPSSKAAPGYNAHVKTRICLSCHDGTIALGNLVNLPYPSTTNVAMQGGVTTMPTTAAGYIGLDLSDDHPVAIQHVGVGGVNSDPELVGTIPAGGVSLYTAAAVKTKNGTGGTYVECTSCHNAHDNQYGSFLVDSNAGSNICRTCHTKQTGGANPATLAHDNSTVSYAPPTIGATVGQVKCMNCHYSHRAGATGAATPFTANPGYGKYLLSFEEDNSCFNNPNRWGQSVSACHGTGSTALNASGRSINIQYQMNKSNAAHSAFRNGSFNPSYSGKHGAMEQGNGVPTSLPKIPNTHVVCSDCHNAHTAGNGALHTAGTNTISTNSALYGAGGVQLLSALGWVVHQATNYSAFEPLGATNSTSMPAQYYEYQLCIKCHSSFAWGAGAPPIASDLAISMTDQVKEFNTGNTAYHTVMGAKNAGSYTPPSASWSNGWSATSLMYCSDCHGNNTSVAEAQGPHGSTNPGILVKPFTDSYDSTNKSNSQPTGELCAQCHNETVYNNSAPIPTDSTNNGTGFLSTSGYNLHNAHKYRAANSSLSTYAYRCVNCHVRIPHGYTRRGMIVVGTDAGATGDASIYATGGVAAAKITAFSQPAAQGYGPTTATSNCTTVAGCHH